MHAESSYDGRVPARLLSPTAPETKTMKMTLKESPGSYSSPSVYPKRRMEMNGMKIVRRTHMYAGLFLAPWVAMYGFSGLIFNHGNWFAPGGDAASKPIEWKVDASALPQWPEPDVLARKVVEALNAARKEKVDAAEYRLSAEGAPPKLQGGVALQGKDEVGGSVSLSF